MPNLDQCLDFYNLMTYDYYTYNFGDPVVAAHHAPLYRQSWDNQVDWDKNFYCDATVNAFIKAGATRSKLMLGIPFYGQSFTLSKLSGHALKWSPPIIDGKDANVKAGKPGLFSDPNHPGSTLGYFEICKNIKKPQAKDRWTKVSDCGSPANINDPCPTIGPYAYHTSDGQWFGYDDANMVAIKTKYAKKKGLGGVMVFDISTDDYKNQCGDGSYPLLTAISNAMNGNTGISNVENGFAAQTTTTTQTTTTRPTPPSPSPATSSNPPTVSTPPPGCNYGYFAKVKEGDTCWSIATYVCGQVRLDNLYKKNQRLDCSTLQIGQYVCC